MPEIKKISAIEILDSRGRPTIKAYCELDNGISAAASVPSGASTGTAEAHELRDDEERFSGMGSQKAVQHINQEINQSLRGKKINSQSDLDQHLIQLDGTANKSNFGANAVLAVSLAFARANAIYRNQALYQYFATIAGTTINYLPRPTINLFSGGKHAGGQVQIQDLLIVPTQNAIMGVLECAYSVYQSAVRLCLEKYEMRALTADEGGLAPPFKTVDSMFVNAIESIEKAGYIPGKDVYLALDAASSQFYLIGKYNLGDLELNSAEMVGVLSDWTSKYPIISLEDGLAEDDWEFWPMLKQKIQSKSLILGDDFLCTNPERIKKAIETDSANALLLKVNQIGTLTEALGALQLAKNSGWQVTISARSGETEDHWLADLAVGWQGDQIKIGSITQSERLAKYNRLLEIEKESGLGVNEWPL